MLKTSLILSLLLSLTLSKVLPITDPSLVGNQPSIVLNQPRPIKNIKNILDQAQPNFTEATPSNGVVLPPIPIGPPSPIGQSQQQPSGPLLIPGPNGPIIPVGPPGSNNIPISIGDIPNVQNIPNIPKSGINFKPFPSAEPGRSIWSAVTPAYSLKKGVDTPIKVVPIISGKITGQVSATKATSTPNKDQVRSYIWSWMGTPIGDGLKNENVVDKQQPLPETKQLKCFLKVFNYSNPSEDLINSDQSMDVLYPGSLIQGKKIEHGATILQKLPISNAYKYPIRIGGNGNFAPRWADSSQAADVHKAIKQAILSSSGFYSPDVFLKLIKSSQISQLLVNLNFNAKIAKILDISGGFYGNWTTKKSKFFITMLQGIADFYPDKMVSDISLISDAVGVFLKQTFTIQEAKALQTFGYWGSGNIPCFINQVTYGRLMIISVEENQRTRKLFAQLQASLAGIGSLDMSMTMTQMFQDSTTKVFSVGPFSPVQVADLKAGNWTNFFTEIPANSQTIQSLKPIGFRIQDFKGQNVKVSNRLQYEQIQCQTKPSKNIKIQLADIYAQAVVYIKRSGQGDFSYFRSVGEGDSPIWDITPNLSSGDNDELKITSWGDSPGWFYSWRRKARLIVWVDNQVVYDYKTQCTGCHSQENAFRCRVDKYSGWVSCNAQ